MRPTTLSIIALLTFAPQGAEHDVATIRGIVQDTSCSPIAGARVSGSYPVRETITGADGRFEIRVPFAVDAAGSKIERPQLHATIAGFRLTARLFGAQSDPARFQTLTLDTAPLEHADPVLAGPQSMPPTTSVPEPGVRGEVLTSRCQPIAGADVRLVVTADGSEFRTTTDPRGRFAFDTALTGTYLLEVDAHGFIHVHRRGTTIAPDGTPVVRVLMDDAANGIIDVLMDK
jgi:hypothetical protein